MYRHFCRRHHEAKIIIVEDGETERCKSCGMFAVDVEKHQKTKTCEEGRKRREMERKQDQQAEAGDRKFFVCGKELERVHEFKYLGRVLCEDDDDTTNIIKQISRGRQKWNLIAKIL